MFYLKFTEEVFQAVGERIFSAYYLQGYNNGEEDKNQQFAPNSAFYCHKIVGNKICYRDGCYDKHFPGSCRNNDNAGEGKDK